MLHGDCLLEGSDPLQISKKSYELAKDSKAIFGYLDHPFSKRYTYGWNDETERTLAHRDLILYIKSSAKQPLFLSEEKALDFLLFKLNKISEHEIILHTNMKNNSDNMHALNIAGRSSR